MAYHIFAFFFCGSAFYSCLFLTNRTWGVGLFWPVCITWPAIPSVYAAVKSPHSLMLFLYSASQGISVRVWLQNSPVLTLCFNCTFIQTVILLQQRVSFSRDNQLPSWIHILHIYLFNVCIMYQRFRHCNSLAACYVHMTSVACLSLESRTDDFAHLIFLAIYKRRLVDTVLAAGKSETAKNNPGSPVWKEFNALKCLIDAKNTPQLEFTCHIFRKWHSHVPFFIIDLV